MNKAKKIAIAIGAMTVIGMAAGCTSPQLDDLKNVNPVYPDYAVVVMNVSGFPNITIVCYDGVAMATTTRDYESMQFQPAFNNICAAHKRNDINAVNGMTPPPGQG
jgi:hypothetical protein